MNDDVLIIKRDTQHPPLLHIRQHNVSQVPSLFTVEMSPMRLHIVMKGYAKTNETVSGLPSLNVVYVTLIYVPHRVKWASLSLWRKP